MPNEQVPTYKSISEIKTLRVQTDALLQSIQSKDKDISNETEGPFSMDGTELYYMALGEAEKSAILTKMWLGKMLEGKGNPFPPELADKAKVQ